MNVTECGSCGAQIEFVAILTTKGARKQHPIDYPRRKTPEGRVTWDPDTEIPGAARPGAFRILDARIVTAKDDAIGPRCGVEWPVDGGAYVSHFDTCPAVYARIVADRTGKPRDEEEVEAQRWADADAHIPRCGACGGLMDEGLAADDRVGGRRRPWRVHPACDPEHRRAGVAEANRLTGRSDLLPVGPAGVGAVSGEELAEIQRTAIRRLAEEERRTHGDWRQGVIDTGGSGAVPA